MTVNQAVERRLLGLIGLGVRARNAVVGVEQVRVAARRGKLKVAIVAPDASPNSLKKVEPLLGALRVRMVRGPGAAALGAAVGRVSTAVVGITDADLARGMMRLLDDGGEEPRRDAAARRTAREPSATKVARRNG
jgi:ribosomal protein L7Ae-like RNA K-turn-binding protein